MFVIAFRLHLQYDDYNNDLVLFLQFSESIKNLIIHIDTSLFKAYNILIIGVGK